MWTPEKPVQILLAEDNPGDVRLTRDAFERCGIPAHLTVAGNGEAALAYLRREGKFADAKRPDLMLLDLNMPGKDGRAVLREMKKDPELDCIPVIVFTSSDAPDDVIKSYKLHACGHIAKPLDNSKYDEVVRSIENFWLTIASLPTSCKTTRDRV